MWLKKIFEKVKSPKNYAKLLFTLDFPASKVRFSPDCSVLCISDKYSNVIFFDVKNQTKLAEFSCSEGGVNKREKTRICYNTKGTEVAVSNEIGGRPLTIFSTKPYSKIPLSNNKFSNEVIDFVYNDNDELLIAYLDTNGRRVVITKFFDAKPSFTIPCDENPIVKFSHLGEIIAVASENDKKLEIFDCQTGERISEFPWDRKYVHGSTAIGISPGCTILAYKFGEWRQISLFDLNTALEIRKLLAIVGDYTRLEDLFFSKDNRFLIACTMGEIRMWDILALREREREDKWEEHLYEWIAHNNSDTCGAISNDNSLLALGWGEIDGVPSLDIWDIRAISEKPASYWENTFPWNSGRYVMMPSGNFQPSIPEKEVGFKLPMYASYGMSAGSEEIKNGIKLK